MAALVDVLIVSALAARSAGGLGASRARYVVSAPRSAVLCLADQPVASELADKLFTRLDRNKDGIVDRAELYAYTKGTSPDFSKFARELLHEAKYAREAFDHLKEQDLLALSRPAVYDAYYALDTGGQGFVDRGTLDDLLAHERVDDMMRVRLRAAIDALPADHAPTIVDVYALNDKHLRVIKEAAVEASRTGYRPPEECETAVDTEWERKLIMESRKGAGGMNFRQNELLREAIKLDGYR